MTEFVKLDWRGRRSLELDERGITLRAPSPYRVPFPTGTPARPFVSNQRLPLTELRMVAVVRRRDKWDLAVGVVMSLIGLAWPALLYPSWIGLVIAYAWILALGVWPLIQYAAGEPFILVATLDRAIALPFLRRRRRDLERILGTLQERCLAAPDRCTVVTRDLPAKWIR